ncbi:MAG: DUF1223 domain-containing protein [Flavobacterium sp.]|nr:DUF1223 domain-containing protein [Flavobacterium sp.]
MKPIFYATLIVIAIVGMGFTLSDNHSDKKTTTAPENGFVVLELFTSQGCSSCPAADAVLGKFISEGGTNIIPLSFHVDYWNYIGWKDPYSKPEYSERQQQYVQRLNATAYTPQLMINGKYEMVGSQENPIRKIINSELKINPVAKIDVTSAIAKNGKLIVKYECSGKGSNIINVALVKKKAITNVGRGENSGRKLTNYNIVTDFITKPLNDNTGEVSIAFDSNKIPSEYSVIVYIQDKAAGSVLAVTKNEIQ